MSTLALLGLLAPLPVAQEAAAPHADLHPQDADLYLGSPRFHEWVESARSSPLARVMEDERVVSALSMLEGSGLDPDTFSLDPEVSLNATLEMLEVPAETREVLIEAHHGLASMSASLGGVHLARAVPAELMAQLDRAAEDFGAVEQALDELAWAGDGTYPADLAALELGAFPDPWGTPYAYARRDDGRGYTLTSLGADGSPGGALAGSDLELRMQPGGFWAQSNLDQVRSALVAGSLDVRVVLEFAETAPAVQVFDLLTGLEDLALDEATGGAVAKAHCVDVAGRALPARVLAVPDSPLPFLAVVRRDATLLLSMGAEPGGCLAALRGQLAGTAAHLGDAPAFAAGVARTRLGIGDTGAGDEPVFVTYRSMPILQLVGHGLELFSRLGGDDEGLDELLGVAELLSGPEPRATFSRWTFEGGEYHVRSFEEMPATPVGLARFLGRTPVQLPDDTPIPGDSMLVYATSLHGGELQDALLGFVASQGGGGDLEQWRGALESQYGCRLEDLFGNLGGSLLVYSDTVRGLAVPRAYAFVDLAEPEAFWTSFEGFAAFLADTFPEEIRLSTRPYKKVPLVTFKTETMSTFVQPSFCVMDGKLIVSVTGSSLKKEIKRRLAAAEGEAEPDEAGPHPLGSSGFVVPTGAQSVYYMDWGSGLSGAYSFVKAFASMAEGMAELPFDLSDLPPAEIFSDNLRPGFHTSRAVPGGLLLEGRSSFGPEVAAGMLFGLVEGFTSVEEEPLPVVGGAGGIFVTPESAAEPIGKTDDAEARTRTRVAFVEVRNALAIYKLETTGFPADLTALTKATDSFPQGLILGGVVPEDGWGSPLLYRLSEDGTTYRLWSTGPDGLNDDGEGDDVNSQ